MRAHLIEVDVLDMMDNNTAVQRHIARCYAARGKMFASTGCSSAATPTPVCTAAGADHD